MDSRRARKGGAVAGLEADATRGDSARDAARGVSAPVLEVFRSVQGEGLHVGTPQVFLRLAGCPLRCRWCDTPGSWVVPARPSARVTEPGAPPRREPAWVVPFLAATWISALDPDARRALSVTGGEPLLWPDFVRALPSFLGGRRLHLETAGAHPEALASVLDAVDHVSLDLKLAHDLDPPVWDEPVRDPPARDETGGPEGAPPPRERVPHDPADWAEARALSLAAVRGRDACAKIVVAGGHGPRPYLALLDEVAAIAPELPLVLQPVTPLGGVPAPTSAELEALVEAALERRLDVRVLPQVHRALRLP